MENLAIFELVLFFFYSLFMLSMVKKIYDRYEEFTKEMDGILKQYKRIVDEHEQK